MNRFIQDINYDYFKDSEFVLDKSNKDFLHNLQKRINNNIKRVKKANITRKEHQQQHDLVGNKFLHNKIINKINNDYKKTISCNLIMDNLDMNIEYNILNDSLFKIDKIDYYNSIFFSWLLIANSLDTTDCVKVINVKLYLVNFKKDLKCLNSNAIGSLNVNGGMTHRCYHDDNEITIYREEDIIKVFFHETMHTFKLDFNNPCKEELKSIVNINSDVNLFESYCETWARTINILYYDLFHKGANTIERLIINESIFAFLQARKVLNHYKLSFVDLHHDVSKVTANFIEETNTFSYYIFTSMMLTHINLFMTFCVTNNENVIKMNSEKVNEYVNIIFDIIRSQNMLMIDKTVPVIDNGTTLRMSYYDSYN